MPPVKPAIPANNLLLGEVYVASTTTTVASGNIIDKTTVTSTSRGAVLTATQTVNATALAAIHIAQHAASCEHELAL